jgi:AraC-like DNA-binding protein
MARRVGLSPSHFRRCFRKFLGRSSSQVVLEARMRRACSYLRESSLSVGEIAETVGYADIFYFSRRFKQHLGCSPTAWRQRGS